MHTLVLRLALTLFCLVPVLPALAQIDLSAGDKTPDVRVLIDVSGSMKQNDPQNLRRPALELLVQLFPPGTKAGVWTFGQWVNMLVPHQVVDDQWRQSALPKARQINSVAMRTNIPEALNRALDDIGRLDPRYQASVILLTDGVVDVSKNDTDNQAAREQIINEIIPRLRAAGVTVHTVALSQNADWQLLEQLALNTNGLSAIAETADDLTRIFLQAYDAAVPAEELPIKDNRFLVDSSVQEFTALIFRRDDSQEAVLMGPDGKEFSRDKRPAGVNWYASGNYDLITVSKPAAGDWQVKAELEPDSRVTVVSNLNLTVSQLSKSLFLGDEHPLTAVLEENDKPITDDKFLDLVDLELTVLRREDGKGWQAKLSTVDAAASGEYRSNLAMLDRPGTYDISVTVDGKTFRREQKQTVKLRDSFSLLVRSDDAVEPPTHSVVIEPVNPALEMNSLKWIAHVQRPDGSTTITAVSQRKASGWDMQLETQGPGHYYVTFEVNGNTQDGHGFHYQSDILDIDHKVAGYVAPAPVVEPVKPESIMPATEESETTEPLAAPETAVAPVVEKSPDESDKGGWRKIALYIGLAIGNIFIIALAYFAYKIVMGGGRSSVLEESDDVDDDESLPAVGVGNAGMATAAVATAAVAAADSLENTDDEPPAVVDLDDDETTESSEVEPPSAADMLDLPDDAIDIDPAADDED